VIDYRIIAKNTLYALFNEDSLRWGSDSEVVLDRAHQGGRMVWIGGTFWLLLRGWW
jgi:hypothetical protein